MNLSALLCLPLCWSAGAAPQEQLLKVAVAELELELPGWPQASAPRGRDPWVRPVVDWPTVQVDGAAQVFWEAGAASSGGISRGDFLEQLRAGTLYLRLAPDGERRGTLSLPTPDGAPGELRVPFRIPDAALSPAPLGEFAAAAAAHYERLTERRLPGAAWFRHARDAARAEVARHGPSEPGEPAAAAEELGTEFDWRDEQDDQRTFALLSGGRALAENLQLDRTLPSSDAAEATVSLEGLRGITVRPFDFAALVAGQEPELDPLSRAVPADQYALYAPSLPALAKLLRQLSRDGAPVLAALEAAGRDARTLQRYERQLGVSLDGLAESLGGLVAQSVAVTGSDPYLRTGTDLALLVEAAEVRPLQLYLAARQAAAAAELGVEVRESTVGSLAVRTAASDDGWLRSYLASGPGLVVLSNSPLQIERIAATLAGESPAAAQSDEYRYFRTRYPRGAAGEAALVVVPDAAIRTWCGPRWRIASARRTQALAWLTDAQLAHRAAQQVPAGGIPALEREHRLLGPLREGARGPWSPLYGSAEFLTPIAELDLRLVTAREAELYDRWRNGYERNWSNFFDPIGASLRLETEALELDLSVLPLIVGSDYRDLLEVVGGESLEGRDGDPHPGAVVHFTSALDPAAEQWRELGSDLSGFDERFGANTLSWLGDWWSVHVDAGPVLDQLLASEDLQEAWEVLETDLDELPLVFQVGVAKPLPLAAFLTAIRGMATSSAPGLVAWHTEQTADGRPFVRVSSAALADSELSIYYATTPKALIVSFNRAALVAALDRWNPPAAGEGSAAEGSPSPASADEGPTPFLGVSAAFEFEPRALLYLGLLDGEDPRQIARAASFDNLPILDEWRRLFPDRDPLAVHEEWFGERLVCPGGGEYRWDGEWQRMASTVYGHPGAPLPGDPLPPALREVEHVRLGLGFEPEIDCLRVRGRLERR
jgi:hypothetical protein